MDVYGCVWMCMDVYCIVQHRSTTPYHTTAYQCMSHKAVLGYARYTRYARYTHYTHIQGKFQSAEALRATAKGEDDEWDEQDDEALVGEEPPKFPGSPRGQAL